MAAVAMPPRSGYGAYASGYGGYGGKTGGPPTVGLRVRGIQLLI
jgi:hypothetical protein